MAPFIEEIFMRTKARFIIAETCNRSCDGCCNKGPVFDKRVGISDLHDLLEFDEVMITGGEPMLDPTKVYDLARFIREHNPSITIYLYSSFYNRSIHSDWWYVLRQIDGLQYTLHYPATPADINAVYDISDIVSRLMVERFFSARLAIDGRLLDTIDFSDIKDKNPNTWKEIRRMEWQTDCPLPEGESLLYRLPL
jgi:hypothetical protein